ncbi:hypothetical protein jhhlp_002870 [Lomentospora prolificans]|uniref:Bacteriophage T5 Orf172 DNA-binding domain-containing protein n=1 Tax=Lomentospora prolificans TaxID=41688 RepID=A0A2N3NF95_9PEZI|nr:hypothetical protein jhhlp_002870 [Lomentospora prolificans]
MPFIPNTPESYLSRSDSLDAETTCHGITSNGNPCRRPLTGSTAGSPSSKRSRKTLDSEELYCWQHKVQAAHHSPSPSPQGGRKSGVLVARSSIDTLTDRLGILGVDSGVGEKKARRPQVEGQIQGGGGRKKKKSGRKTLLCCFCFHIPLEEPRRQPERPQPRPVQRIDGGKPSVVSTPTKPRPTASTGAQSAPARLYGPESAQNRKSSGKQQAGNYLSLIPASTDPQTAAVLMAELAKPYVESEEPGYIYMFWMTPTDSKPPVDAARQFLAPPSKVSGSGSPRHSSQRRASDAMLSYYEKTPGKNGGGGGDGAGRKRKTMLLKIGRAANVQRRMNQWSRQCDYDVEVLRFYPYIPGSERSVSGSSGAGRDGNRLSPAARGLPRMTPHVRKVERLIHLELQGMGLRAELETCGACGKEHREWFEVGASRGEVRVVDEVIRRWVAWDEARV